MHINVYFLAAAAGVVAVLWEVWRTFWRSRNEDVGEIVGRALEPLITRLTIMETKFDLVWRNITLNSISVLHHPDPTRRRVDELLDRFRSESINTDEMEELRGYLDIIVHWEDGSDAPFTIYPGEQSAAAIVLGTMDHIVTPKECDGLPDHPAGTGTEAGTRLPD